jgi:hypothetical protein
LKAKKSADPVQDQARQDQLVDLFDLIRTPFFLYFLMELRYSGSKQMS